VKVSLVGCAVKVTALSAILVAATVALGETYAQFPIGASMQTVARDGDAAEAGAALEDLRAPTSGN
jgi:hypothetical protein